MYEILFILHFNTHIESVSVKCDKPTKRVREVEDNSEGIYIEWTIFFDKKILCSGEINKPKGGD